MGIVGQNTLEIIRSAAGADFRLDLFDRSWIKNGLPKPASPVPGSGFFVFLGSLFPGRRIGGGGPARILRVLVEPCLEFFHPLGEDGDLLQAVHEEIQNTLRRVSKSFFRDVEFLEKIGLEHRLRPRLAVRVVHI